MEIKNNERLEALKQLLPEIFDKDNALNIEKLQSFCKNSEIAISDESYRLNFSGKNVATKLANIKPSTIICADNKHNYLDENKESQNILIKGDNLEVLRHLKRAYAEKIKMIYIDPPYNTNNKDFVYNDSKAWDLESLLKLGIEEKEANRVLEWSNKGSNSHSAWLSFMYPRLFLARKLLKDDGVIFISIDDNEMAQLKLLCDEIFGEGNFVADFIRKTKSTTNDAKIGINYQHEFLLCYAKNKEFVNLLGGQKNLENYKNPDNDPNGAWISDNPSAKSGNMKTGYFAVTNPYTNKVDYPPKGRFWLFSQDTIQKHIDEGRICFKKEHKDNERGFIYKRYLKDLKTTQKTFDSLEFSDNLYMNQVATKELLKLELAEYFSYPKGVDFMAKIIEHATNENDIILDFFAGSGTTAHAVLESNKNDYQKSSAGGGGYLIA
ncbi:site-specific DNA-methyltransferase [Helicobacter cetorum]|uniref:site-specific DNA-methyltransferase n=1 Tax=Helicobacter cetorum TaxID=138563 RepID=UPI000CF12002|nr:site-specific DNA-methyltransferase [Helicobacter cetorum]